jgi:hypothetical protein
MILNQQMKELSEWNTPWLIAQQKYRRSNKKLLVKNLGQYSQYSLIRHLFGPFWVGLKDFAVLHQVVYVLVVTSGSFKQLINTVCILKDDSVLDYVTGYKCKSEHL